MTKEIHSEMEMIVVDFSLLYLRRTKGFLLSSPAAKDLAGKGKNSFGRVCQITNYNSEVYETLWVHYKMALQKTVFYQFNPSVLRPIEREQLMDTSHLLKQLLTTVTENETLVRIYSAQPAF